MYGGIETALTSLAQLKNLSSTMEQAFGVCFPGRQREELLAANVQVHDLGPVRLSRPWTILAARSKLRESLALSKCDIAITHGSWIHCIAGPTIRRYGVPLVTWVHGTLDAMRPLERLASMTNPDLIIANSAHTKLTATKVFSRAPIEVLYFPIASQNIAMASDLREKNRRELGVDNHQKVIFLASRMEPCKGHATLLEALGKLNHRNDWICWIAGGPHGESESKYFSAIQKIAHSLGGHARVKFLGQRNDVPQLMQLSDVFCQPNSTPDSFGIAFIESLYAGLPVVTSDIGGGGEIVDESCGILTKPNDATSVAKAIESLLDDPHRLRYLSLNGPRRADQLCNAHRQFAQLETVLRKACFLNLNGE